MRPNDEIVAAATKVLEGFDKGIFIRSTFDDTNPGWAIRLMPYIQALAQLQRLAQSNEQSTEVP